MRNPTTVHTITAADGSRLTIETRVRRSDGVVAVEVFRETGPAVPLMRGEFTAREPLHYVPNANASVTSAACGAGIRTREDRYTESTEHATCPACVEAIARGRNRRGAPAVEAR